MKCKGLSYSYRVQFPVPLWHMTFSTLNTKGLNSSHTGEPRLARRKQQSCFIFIFCAMYMSFWRQTQFQIESFHKATHFSYDYKCACYKLQPLNTNFDRPSTESWEPIQTSFWTVQKELGRASCRQLGEHTGSTNNCWYNFILLPC